jgi:hypothetical protein
VAAGDARDAAGARSSKTALPYGLGDSLAALFDAKNRRDIAGFLAFYDPEGFKFPGGSFKEWQARTGARLRSGAGTGFVIDSAWQGMERPPFIETNVRLRPSKGPSAPGVVIAMIWKNGSNGWRIAAEKEK